MNSCKRILYSAFEYIYKDIKLDTWNDKKIVFVRIYERIFCICAQYKKQWKHNFKIAQYAALKRIN